MPAHRSAPDDPGFHLRFARSGDVLKVAVSGDIDAQYVRIGYWRAIAEEARRRGLRRLLVTDRRKGVPATPEELGELALLFRHEAPNFDRVAVIEPVVAFLPTMEHAEIFGRAAGINVRIFGDARTAEVWVRHGDE